MILEEIKTKQEEIIEKWNNLKDILKPEKLQEEIKVLDSQMADPNFWNDPKKAQEISSKRNYLGEKLEEILKIDKKVKDLQDYIQLLEMEKDESLYTEVEKEINHLEKELERLEISSLLSDEMDSKNAILTLQAGSGGVEACDWTQMLMRMYLRWAEGKGFQVEIVDYQPDDVAGIKSATIIIKGPFAYGYLKGEQGVHRLVRISPFDANKRRHTSFAAVSVIPEIDEEIKVEINEEDLRIDTFRASGAGGQHVNKTDSAVRITHIPTGIVVACQSERSQLQNKLKALNMLKAKLYQLELQKQKEKQKELEGEKKDITWGNQIRSYVFQPYQMVKDLRTGYEVGNVEAVMDGDIDGFIESYLKWKAKEKND
ncbi:peptide chain release factor 2 [Sulfurihydrogenibium azorense Az-Fu1]|uniref:Peptide chain release factor 2 n=1 Tax=Sulfurihydrogenibium azorense (strain DSM 15241 / OCM 825 / Az-Fu1) TaxID=204536 RepID=C1DXP5_SULAA|nr:peptide chain release factor 2 [Sulfurihydrogenibium azorense]ACN99324.1 peptide chain release factor 2 [Sulfurihydrogenibium azorense Az-Fu1]